MSAPIERWAKRAVLLEREGSYEPVASPGAVQDLELLSQLHRATWRERERSLRDSGDPIALEGLYAGLQAQPPAASPGNVASLNGTAALWTSSIWTPFAANSLLAPSAWRIVYMANVTTSTSPGNIGFDPRIGAGSTAGSAIAGTTLGASGNVALTASITAAFVRVVGDVVIRTIGAPGNNSTAFGYFHYIGTQATSSGLAGPAAVGAGHNLLFGGASASFDASVAGGFSLGAIHTVTTITHIPQQIYALSLN